MAAMLNIRAHAVSPHQRLLAPRAVGRHSPGDAGVAAIRAKAQRPVQLQLDIQLRAATCCTIWRGNHSD